MEVIERELSDEFNQCWFNDELDPKKFSVLHERDAQATIDFCIIELYEVEVDNRKRDTK